MKFIVNFLKWRKWEFQYKIPPPPPPPPPPLINLHPVSLEKNNINNAVNTPQNARNALFAELLSKKGSVLKKSDSAKIKILNNSPKNDARVPSLEQIKEAIHKMKMSSSC